MPEHSSPAARLLAAAPSEPPTPEALMAAVARGDERAFEALYDEFSGPVFGTVRRVVRDVAQSEEVTQEVFVELWRTATRFDADRASLRTWVMTLAHRRAVDRVRSAQSATDRDHRIGAASIDTPYDEVAEAVAVTLEHEAVRRCLGSLTELQRESLSLAYYQGYTYVEVAQVLDTPLGTVKTRMRDALIRMRDCLGVAS